MHPLLSAIRIAAAIASIVLCLTGCESKVSAANFNRIQTGMTRSEVVQILGEPDHTVGAAFGGISGQSATWTRGEDTISVQFVNDKVVAKQSSIGSEPARKSSGNRSSAIDLPYHLSASQAHQVAAKPVRT